MATRVPNAPPLEMRVITAPVLIELSPEDWVTLSATLDLAEAVGWAASGMKWRRFPGSHTVAGRLRELARLVRARSAMGRDEKG